MPSKWRIALQLAGYALFCSVIVAAGLLAIVTCLKLTYGIIVGGIPL